MRFYETSAQIEAGPEAVWAVLADGAAWPSWDSGVQAVDGELAPGGTVTVRSSAAPGRAFPVTVTAFEAPRRMQFSGGMPAGLFRGRRDYTLEAASGGTRFVMREEYTGPLLPLIWRTMPDLQPRSTGSRRA